MKAFKKVFLVFMVSIGLFTLSACNEETGTDAPEESTTVWFYNLDGYEDVHAYVHGDEGEVLGEWPGEAAVQDGSTDWWSIDVPLSEGTPFNIIFNNGDDQEAESVTIDDAENLYVINTGAYLYASKTNAEDAIASQDSTTLWFYNSENWSEVYAHAYSESDNLLGEWPGEVATQDGTTEWWSIDVPADPETTSFNIIFNDNAGAQSGDALIDDTTDIYLTIESDGTYPSKADAEAAMEEDPVEETTTRVYFLNSGEWTTLHAYTYIDSDPVGSAWPGDNATHDEGDWWYYDVPLDGTTDPFNIIFNNGDSQAGDTLVDSSGPVYLTVEADTVYSDKAQAEAAMADAGESTTVWFYNTDGWSDVYAYTWGDPGETLGGWPGTEATQDGTTDWWSVEVPVDASITAFNIKFTNNDGLESGGSYINSLEAVHTTMEADSAYATKDAAEIAMDEASSFNPTTVWFYNADGWSTVYAYVHGDSGTALGEWPGSEMTLDAEGWYQIEVPLQSDVQPFSVIFNNNDTLQTGGAYVDSGETVYLTTIDDQVFTSKADVEAALEPEDPTASTTVWFYNSEGWSDVYLHAYTDAGNVFGDWPGEAAVQDGTTDWWSVDVPLDPATDPFNVIFNTTDGAQSGGAFVDDATNLYATIEADGLYDSRSAAEASLEEPAASTTVWFYNSEGWNEVYLHAYTGDGNVFGGWPGEAAVQDGTTDWWSIDVPLDPAVNPFNVIFHNNAGAQSGDAFVDDATNLYATIETDGLYGSKDAAQTAMSDTTPTTVWFYNSDEWTTVNAYVHGDSGEALGGWPGSEMTQDAEGWYQIEVPLESAVQPFNIIFNNNDGSQTNGAYIDSGDTVYLTTIADQVFTSKADAEAAIASQASTTLWFYNSQGWSDVYAHVYNDNGNVFGDWPGEAATQDGTTAWWSVDVPLDPTTEPFNVIFNNNAGNQSGGAYITDKTNIYITTEADGTYDSRTAAETAMTQ